MSVDKKVKKAKPNTDQGKDNEQSSSSSEDEEVMDAEDEDNDDQNSTDDDDEDVHEIGNDEMETFDFLGYPVKNCDREIVSKLLKSSILKDTEINAGEVTDLLIKNPDIGTVLKSANDEDDEEDMDEDSPIAVIGFIHFGVDGKESVVSQLKKWIQDKIDIQSDPSLKEIASKYLQRNTTALMLSARCVNLGGPLIVESLKEMKKDLETKKQYVFKEVLIVLSMFNSKKDNELTSNFMFDEEKVFAENAEFQFDFQLTAELENSMEYVDQTTGKRAKGTPFKKIVGLTKKSFTDCLEIMAAQFSQQI